MTDALAIYKDFDGLQRVAIALYESGYFPDVQSKAKAITKVLAGAEIGIPPFAAMTGIHVIQGKPVLGANLIATLVKNDPRYDYKIKQCDDKACILEWFEDGVKTGEAGFTIQEAQNAGLTTKDNWKKYTSDMLFARAISRGSRRFAPGIFGGSPVYTPDELGVETDEDGYIEHSEQTIDAEYRDTEINTTVEKPEEDSLDGTLEAVGPKAIPLPEADDQPAAKRIFGPRPWDPYTLRDALKVRAEGKNVRYQASDAQRNLLGSLLSEFFVGDDIRRHTVQLWLLGAASIKDKNISGGMVKTALDWLKPAQDESGAYSINAISKRELSGVYDAAIRDEGQQEMEM